MKILKPILACFLFLVSCFLFLLITPNVSKPAYAATCANNTSSIAAGGNISVGYSGIDLALYHAAVVINNTAPGNPSFTLTGTFTWLPPTNFTLPNNTAPGTYNVVVVVAENPPGTGVAYVGCTGPTLTVSGGGGGGGAASTVACGQSTAAGDSFDKLNRLAITKNVFDDKLFNANQIGGTADSLYMLISGCSQLHPQTNAATMGTGALAASSKLVVAMYGTPPVSGVQYFAQEFQRFNPVKEAYAQNGIGYNALAPVQKIWEAFRNISYMGFIIVFVVIGFMIMFRSRISPQAVATVQDSLPRIVIALILVTFSYAIAGLMIDIMFLFLNIVINALKGAGVLNDNANAVFTKSVFGVVWGSWHDIFSSVKDALSNIIGKTLQLGKIGDLFGFFGGAIGGIIVGIAMLYIMFRVFFMLLIAYATIILLTMAAPFFFLFQALPGNNGAKEWFKQMAANVSIFPVTALMFIFAGILGSLPDLGSTGVGELSGAQIGQFPLLAGDISAGAVGKLIAIGFLLLTPTAADMVKKAIAGQGGGGGGLGAGAAMASLGAGAGFAAGASGRALKGAQEHFPSQYDATAGASTSRSRYFNPAYWKRRGEISQAGKQLDTDVGIGRVTKVTPPPGTPTYRKK